jgi:hypothetical protein
VLGDELDGAVVEESVVNIYVFSSPVPPGITLAVRYCGTGIPPEPGISGILAFR